MQNKVQLIAYVDRLVEGGLEDLYRLLSNEFKGLFGGIHILPFFFPVDGSDAGFDPIDHSRVDPRLGNWEDVKKIAHDWDVMADLIVNHISADSSQFQDFIEHADESKYRDLFLSKETVFSNGTEITDIDRIYRPRPGLPFTTVSFKNGQSREMWTTFTSNQIDINVLHPIGENYLQSIMEKMNKAGIGLLRLDAVGYAIKKAGTSCFMLPETYTFIEDLTSRANKLGMRVLVEIHSHHQDQIEIARITDYVYDFALPPLILHALYRGTGEFLLKWLNISPRNCITVLDTHDGIGIMDIGRCQRIPEREGLLPEGEIAFLLEEMHLRTNGESLEATGAKAKNLDLYQVNSTYYDVLGRDDDLYLMARAIQLFAPGIPQVYYMGLLGETNDMKLFGKTGVGRDINRHYFNREEIKISLQKPVVQRLSRLIRLRNEDPSFNGEFEFELHDEGKLLNMTWTSDKHRSQLMADLPKGKFKIILYAISKLSGEIKAVQTIEI